MLISIGEVFRNGREKRKRCLKMTATIIDVFIETERLPFVDVAKGILTILVIIYHIPPSMTLNTVNCNSIIGDISYNTRIWFDAFFMPAFFIMAL